MQEQEDRSAAPPILTRHSIGPKRSSTMPPKACQTSHVCVIALILLITSDTV